MTNNHYYITAPTSSPLKEEKSAIRQEDELYLFMRNNGGLWNKWTLQDHFPQWGESAIGRALWNLEFKDNKIRQEGFIKERKGRLVGQYRVVYQSEQGNLFG